MSPFSEAADYLFAQSGESLLRLYWFVMIFEVPRYLLLFAATAFLPRIREDERPYPGRVSVVIAGHSEETSIEKCVAALREQSRVPDEIVVVSDGSTDGMPATISRMLRANLIDAAHTTELRSGKSAGTNMAARLCTGDVIVNVDCDCSFDRHAIRNLLRPFADDRVAAVCGSILPRNMHRSLIAAFQGIEYMISISLGKQAADRVGQVTCISGAFGAFRRDAYEMTGGLDAGGGEDLDLTIRLRRSGWKVRFAADAQCYTDVPETRAVLVRQRFRWERDAVRLRYRKHADMLNPFSRRFRWSELLHELEFLLFNVIAAAAMPFYLIWLFHTYGSFAFTVLLAAQLGLLMLDLLVFLLAASATPKISGVALLPYLLGYSVFYGVYMRFVRLVAYLDEWIFRSSYADSYVPDKVHKVRG
ncbi:glycosyltransferase [Jannaschia donghaensis]|uniref:Poly-beta-1,6-N-acetyl-D-glucosamine synthase n=1 Tax=Jannaschia donghaensis TaxID=420998 RepID=A0A0M6YJT8_9RHOB|nr:glycosyltransferase family 2 protein [Jannaschia donghaensis]CTQ50621.1 Poly-beta-1,6-N-acetyl-D-glucosamine synthase [Jannaschia donghaensis]